MDTQELLIKKWEEKQETKLMWSEIYPMRSIKSLLISSKLIEAPPLHFIWSEFISK